ncbi:MAG TPA: response regulator [Elusimicrobiales bacterium]|nr:response regulator [Elusimicrobiales bacterium]
MNGKLLIVDDEEHILKMLSEFFKTEGVEVVTAGDGETALKYLKSNNVDLMISDIMMPRLSGVKLFYEVRKIDPFLQFIVITGYPSIQNIVEMLEAGVNDFIVKPFSLKDLREVVDQAFARVERWRKLRNDWITHSKSAPEK